MRRLQAVEKRNTGRRWVILAIVVVLAASLALMWRLTPLNQMLDPNWLVERFRIVLESEWAPLIITLAYLIANVVMFPNMALNLALILALGPVLGVPVALLETLVVGLAAFWLGRRWGGSHIERFKTPMLEKSLTLIQDSGLPGMILLRMIPVAPYPIVNIWLGASSVRTRVFILGTAIGVFPSLLAMGVIGLQLRELWESPTPSNTAILLAIVMAYVLLGWMVKQNISARMRSES